MAHLVAVAGSLSGQIVMTRWLLAWCSFLATFGVESVQPICPEQVLRDEQLFAAVLLAGRDVFGVLLGSDGRFLDLEVASCLLGGYFCIFLKSTKKKRMLISLARVEWLKMASFSAHLVAGAGSLSGQIVMTRWLLAWCSFLAAFGVESVQPKSPEDVLEVERLFAAV